MAGLWPNVSFWWAGKESVWKEYVFRRRWASVHVWNASCKQTRTLSWVVCSCLCTRLFGSLFYNGLYVMLFWIYHVFTHGTDAGMYGGGGDHTDGNTIYPLVVWDTPTVGPHVSPGEVSDLMLRHSLSLCVWVCVFLCAVKGTSGSGFKRPFGFIHL